MYSLVIFGVITSYNACSNKRVNCQGKSWCELGRNDVSNECAAPFPQALHYLILISEVEEVEIFKICLEYWSALAAELYRESPFSSSSSPLILGTKPLQEMPARRQLYNPVLSKVSHKDLSPDPAPCLVLNTEPRLLSNLVYFRASHKSL